MRTLATALFVSTIAGAASPAGAAALPHYSNGEVACSDGSRIPYKWSAPGWMSQPPASQMKGACDMAAAKRRMAGAGTMTSHIGGQPMSREEFNRNAERLIGTKPK